ncbi:MAG: histidine kinase [Bacteroidota bacterium]
MSMRTTWLPRLRLLSLMVAVGALAGLAVQWFSQDPLMLDWLRVATWRDPALHLLPYDGIGYGIVYCVSIWSTVIGVMRLAHRRIPLRTWRDLATHVLLISGAVGVVFAVVSVMTALFCLYVLGQLAGSAPPLYIPALVTVVITLVITACCYAVGFYQRLRDAEQQTMQAELRALRAQINPHFLFNTLNSIAALVHRRPDEAEAVIEHLADLFRYTLRASQQPRVTLADEIEATEQYIAIEQARFRERLFVTRAIAPEVETAEMPSLILQPIVENAVKHGVAKTEDACAVQIEGSRLGQRVTLCVRDTGPGFDTTDLEAVLARGTGLSNVYHRLKAHFGEEASLTLLPDGVCLQFPYWSGAPARVPHEATARAI